MISPGGQAGEIAGLDLQMPETEDNRQPARYFCSGACAPGGYFNLPAAVPARFFVSISMPNSNSAAGESVRPDIRTTPYGMARQSSASKP
jgi:hypothetical protein